MFGNKVSIEEKNSAREKLSASFGAVEEIDNIPVEEFMIKWLSAFAPDMTFADAKSISSPSRMLNPPVLPITTSTSFCFSVTYFICFPAIISAISQRFLLLLGSLLLVIFLKKSDIPIFISF